MNQRARVDVPLEVGAISESVSVTGEAPVLQTDTTQVGAVVDANQIDHTPLISRNPVALSLLTAGVTTPDPTSFNSGQRTTGGGRPYVNGNREEANNFLLDGVDNNFTSDDLVSYQPNPDAIEEFKLITNNASAEFGNFQGGIINVVIKSGTNQFHGNVFEYFRNDKLNADNWGSNWQGLPARPLRWNQFGGTVRRPHYQGQALLLRRLSRPAAGTLRRSVPPPRDADWPGARAIFRPCSIRRRPPARSSSSTTLTRLDATTGLRAPFPGNIIPQSLLSPAAVKLVNNLRCIRRRRSTGITTPTYYYGSKPAISTPTRATSSWTGARTTRTTSRRAIPKGARTARRQQLPAFL